MLRLQPVATLTLRGSVPGLVQLGRPQAAHRVPWRFSRWQSTEAAAAVTIAAAAKDPPPSVDSTEASRPTLAIPCEARHNPIGVQQLSDIVHKQTFLNESVPPPNDLVELAKAHLERHNLLGKQTDTTPPIGFEVPTLQGSTLDEHFYRLGVESAQPYLDLAKRFAWYNLPSKPIKWIRKSGWTKYTTDGNPPFSIPVPDDNLLCFDVEVLYKESPFAIMACAASPLAWYVWLSPWLLGESETDKHLIPLGAPDQDRIVVGHNVGYDRARTLEEYDLKQSRTAFIDTMSLHVAVNGMCSQQRPTWIKHKKQRELKKRVSSSMPDDVTLAELLKSASDCEEEEEIWVGKSSINSLRDVAEFHLTLAIDKSIREEFGELDRAGVVDKLDQLLQYCAADVEVTHMVYKAVITAYLEFCPHPVSFAALRHLSSVILPVNRSWDAYISNAESKYQQLDAGVRERLERLARTAVELKDAEHVWRNDNWLRQLDWSGQEIRMTKGSKKEPSRPVARQKLPGMPKWYKDLFTKVDGPMKLTVRTRLAVLLLKLSWDGHPLFWSDKYGWTFRVRAKDAEQYRNGAAVLCNMEDEPIEALKWDIEHLYFKLPHKDGPTARCTNPLAKSYLMYFENGRLSSEYPLAKEALEMNASCSYWISARKRIMEQMVIYQSDISPAPAAAQSDAPPGDQLITPPVVMTGDAPSHLELGYILPQVIPMGTITRRSVERTWLTASNAKKNRVGSELKAMVKAPPGYSFVGADVDSEELWIASLMGDATFKLHGGNAIGFMTLEGTKAAGTDLHSRTASILGISRNDAKVFNYGRIYGAGLKFAATLLRQFNPSLSENETNEIAGKLYAATKGFKAMKKALCPRQFWRGGTESFVFNKLEEFAEQDKARTPILGATITEALMARHVSKGGYLTSRINWAIQSSGVDYLHLLIVGMDYLIRRFNIEARLAITVHDEIRYLVKNHDRYRAAMALQVANLWTRAMFAEQVGINDLPQSCAFFSAVDIDHVLRKEVDMPCITPSHETAIPPGESLDIQALLAKGPEAYLDPNLANTHPHIPTGLEKIPFTPRIPVMQQLQSNAPTGQSQHTFIRAQMATTDEELKEVIKEGRPNRKASNATATTTAPKARSSRSLFPKLSGASKPDLPQFRDTVMLKDALQTDAKYQGPSSKQLSIGFHKKQSGSTTSWPGSGDGSSSGSSSNGGGGGSSS